MRVIVVEIVIEMTVDKDVIEDLKDVVEVVDDAFDDVVVYILCNFDDICKAVGEIVSKTY